MDPHPPGLTHFLIFMNDRIHFRVEGLRPGGRHVRIRNGVRPGQSPYGIPYDELRAFGPGPFKILTPEQAGEGSRLVRVPVYVPPESTSSPKPEAPPASSSPRPFQSGFPKTPQRPPGFKKPSDD